MLSTTPSSFYIEKNHRVAHAGGQVLVNAASYRRIVGCLIYLTVTRPNLAYVVHILSQCVLFVISKAHPVRHSLTFG